MTVWKNPLIFCAEFFRCDLRFLTSSSYRNSWKSYYAPKKVYTTIWLFKKILWFSVRYFSAAICDFWPHCHTNVPEKFTIRRKKVYTPIWLFEKIFQDILLFAEDLKSDFAGDWRLAGKDVMELNAAGGSCWQSCDIKPAGARAGFPAFSSNWSLKKEKGFEKEKTYSNP